MSRSLCCVESSDFVLDLCVAAALDAVKERVAVPWASSTTSTTALPLAAPQTPEPAPPSTEAPSPTPDSVLEPTVEVADADVSSEAAAVLPTIVSEPSASATTDTAVAEPSAEEVKPPRELSWHNFAKALKEITPSASESLGTLADLRKWNEEFGEGRKDKKRVQVWGKGRFGFTLPGLGGEPAEGHVGKSDAEG